MALACYEIVELEAVFHCLLLVEEVESNAILSSLNYVVVKGRRVPAVPTFSLVGLFP